MATKATNIEFLLSQVRNSVGSLADGTVTVAAAGDATSTPITIWLDRDKASPAANPYTLDSNGTAQLYADGLIKIVIKNSAGTTVYTRDTLNYVDYLTNQHFDSDYASLNAAITSIGATVTTLKIRTANFPMTGAAVVPSTLSLEFESPGSIKNDYALTINSPSEIGDYQVFTGSGAVTGLKESKPEWWQVNTTPGTTDMSIAVSNAINSLSDGGVLYLSSAYGMGSASWVGVLVSAKSNITMKALHEGAGFKLLATPSQTLTLTGVDSPSMIKFLNSSYIKIDGVKFDMNNIFGSGLGLENVSYSEIIHNYFVNAREATNTLLPAGIYAERGTYNKYIGNTFRDCVGGLLLGMSGTLNTSERYAEVLDNTFSNPAGVAYGTAAIGNRFKHSRISGNLIDSWGSVGIYTGSDAIEMSTYNEISKNIIINPVLSGIENLSTTSGVTTHTQYLDNIIYGGHNVGIYLLGISDCDIMGNRIIDFGGTTHGGAIYISQYPAASMPIKNLRVKNNIIYDTRTGANRTGYHGITVSDANDNSTNWDIADNNVSNLLNDLIHLETTSAAPSGIRISGNTGTKGVKNGLYLSGAWNGGEIDNNVFTGNNTGSGGDADMFMPISGVVGTIEIGNNRVDTAGADNMYLAASQNFNRQMFSSIELANATPTVAWRMFVTSGVAVQVSAEVVANEASSGGRAAYKRDALVYNTGAGAVLEGAVSAPLTVESVGGWDCTLDVSGNYVRLLLTGDAHSTSWAGKITTTVVNAP